MKVSYSSVQNGQYGLPAPQAVHDLQAYICQRECKFPDCECKSNGLKFTDMYMLTSCEIHKVDSDDTLGLFDKSAEDDDDDFEV